MDKWSLANKTSNINHLDGKILIEVDGFYNVYLQVMKRKLQFLICIKTKQLKADIFFN